MGQIKVLMPGEVLCNCTEIGCDTELSMIGGANIFRGICRSKGGQCRREVIYNIETGEQLQMILS
jgi:hypothetical protein